MSRFRLIKIGTSYGITIPMKVAKLYIENGFIEMEYSDEKARQQALEVFGRKSTKIMKRLHRNMKKKKYDYTLCDFHQMCKGSCGCK